VGQTGTSSAADFPSIRWTTTTPEIILGSLKQINTPRVWSQTDALSTVYRGRLNHVFDCLSTAFIRSFQKGLHLCLEAQASCGCPGDDDNTAPRLKTKCRRSTGLGWLGMISQSKPNWPFTRWARSITCQQSPRLSTYTRRRKDFPN
jgi:hypothetical protein